MYNFRNNTLVYGFLTLIYNLSFSHILYFNSKYTFKIHVKKTLILNRLGYFLLISFHEYVEHHKSIFNVKKDYSKVKKKNQIYPKIP